MESLIHPQTLPMSINMIEQFLIQLQANQVSPAMSVPTTYPTNFATPPFHSSSSFPGSSSLRKRRATVAFSPAERFHPKLSDCELLTTLTNDARATPPLGSQPGSSNSSGSPLIDDDVLLNQLQHGIEAMNESGSIADLVSLPVGGSDGPVNVKSTVLGSIPLNCLLDGGEQWVALPQVIARALVTHDLRFVVSKLHYLGVLETAATPEQLFALKRRKVVPPSTSKCYLITKPCAEQLVAAVHDPTTFCALQDIKYDPILIHHQSFGGGQGRLFAALYPSACIECLSCKSCMTPRAFVRHSHNTKISAPLHWGCETTNWTDYVALHSAVAEDENQKVQFDTFIRRVTDTDQAEVEVFLPEQVAEKKASDVSVSTPSMFPSREFETIATQLLAQQQTQQQNHVAMPETTVSNITAALTAISQMSQQPNMIAVAQLQQQNILAALAQQQQQQLTSASSSINALSVLNHLLNQTALLNANMVSATQQNAQLEDGESLRKRVNTVLDPTMQILMSHQQQQQQQQQQQPQPQRCTNEFAKTGINFGTLPEDRELLTMLQQSTTRENVKFITARINSALTRRMQPIVAENACLRRELKDVQFQLQTKTKELAHVTGNTQPEPIEVDAVVTLLSSR